MSKKTITYLIFAAVAFAAYKWWTSRKATVQPPKATTTPSDVAPYQSVSGAATATANILNMVPGLNF